MAPPATGYTRMAKAGSRFAKLMGWVGAAAALLSFGTALYELVHARGELEERRRVVAERLTSGLVVQSAGYYPAAWDNFQEASTVAATDGLFAKLLGGLSKEREQIRTAQENLAMEWIRAARATEGQSFAELADKLVSVLAAGASSSSGPRKADLLAHLGWAYFLKFRSGDTEVMPDVPYRQAVAIDPKNPYANVFWAHWILWSHGPMSEAQAHFAAALATDRARADVRRFQLAALANDHGDEAQAEWLRVLEEMREHGEPLTAAMRHDLYGRYYFALNDPAALQKLLAAVPAGKQVELQRTLLRSGELEDSQKSVVKAIMAMTLEADSRKDESLATWRELLADNAANPQSSLVARARDEVRRLSRASRR